MSPPVRGEAGGISVAGDLEESHGELPWFQAMKANLEDLERADFTLIFAGFHGLNIQMNRKIMTKIMYDRHKNCDQPWVIDLHPLSI